MSGEGSQGDMDKNASPEEEGEGSRRRPIIEDEVSGTGDDVSGREFGDPCSRAQKRTSEGPTSQSSSKKALFTNRCSILCHNTATEVMGFIEGDGAYLTNTRIFHKKMSEWAKSQMSSSTRQTWVCSSCISFGKAILSGKSEDDIYEDADERSISFIVKRIRKNLVKHEHIMKLATAIGGTCRKELDVLCSRSRPKYTDLVQTYTDAWNSNGLIVMKEFLEASSGFSDLASQKIYHGRRHLQKAAESLCLVSNPRFVSPTAAAESIVLHAVSGSRAACDMYAAVNASGGHTYITNLINSISAVAPEFPSGDIYVAFDNQQIIGREYRVTAGGAHKTSVVTTVAVYKEELPVNVQSSFETLTVPPVPSSEPSSLWEMFLKREEGWSNIHRSYRNTWITKRLMLGKEIYAINSGILDDKDVQAIIQSRRYEDGLDYSDVPKVKSCCTVTDMESLDVNPNSFNSVTKVLDKLLEMNNRSDPCRKWFSLYCDGLPYGIAAKLIQSTFTCETCNITGSETVVRRHECNDVKCARKYQKILLRPGAGHIEINLVRTVFREYFDIFIRPIAQRLGFVSPTSLEYCKSALDHHKSWQILKIIYVALTDELIHVYATDDAQDFTYDSFSKWKSNQKNPNILLAFDFAFTILHSLFLFRSSIRQCNDTVAYAALYKAAPLFFGFNHPKYREIVSRDFFMDICSPGEGFPTARRLAFQLCGSTSGQGLDFLLEERNRAQKNWVFSSGPPTLIQWKRASASLPFLEKVRFKVGATVHSNLEWNQPKLSKLRPTFGDEYLMARAYYREILCDIGPSLQTFSLDKSPLNPKFSNCYAQSLDNMRNYLKCYVQGKKCVLNVVYGQYLENKPPDEIRKLARRMLRPISGYVKAEFERRLSVAAEVNELVEIIGDIEAHVEDLDCSFGDT